MNKQLELLEESRTIFTPQVTRIVIAGDAIAKLSHSSEVFTAKEDFIKKIEDYQDSNPLMIDLKKKIKAELRKVSEQDLFSILNSLSSFSLQNDFEILNQYLFAAGSFRSSTYNDGARTGLDELALKLAQIRPEESVLDPTCGVNGSWLKLLETNPAQKLDLQEINQFDADLAYLNTKILKATHTQVYQGDTLRDPKYIENGKLKLFDKVITFPPISMRVPKDAIKANKFNRFRFGKVSSVIGDLAFISNAIASLNKDGKAVIIVSDGPLFRGGDNTAFRKNLVDHDLVEAVISLPKDLLLYANIPVNILIINKDKGSFKGKIQFINANQKGWYKKDRIGVSLTAEGIKEITNLYESKTGVTGKSSIIQDSEYKDTLGVKQYVLPQSISINGTKYHINQDNLQKFDYVSLSKMVKISRGYNVTRRSEDPKGNFLTIKVININDNHKIDYNGLVHVNIKTDPARYLLKKNDILISTRGTIGKIALVNKDVNNLVANANLAVLRAKTDQVNMKWLMLYLASPLGQFMIQQQTTGTAISTIPTKDLQEIKVPKTPLVEQNKAVTAYEKTKKELDNQKAELLKKYHANDEKLYESMVVNKILNN